MKFYSRVGTRQTVKRGGAGPTLRTLSSRERLCTSHIISQKLINNATTQPTISSTKTPPTLATSRARAPPSSVVPYGRRQDFWLSLLTLRLTVAHLASAYLDASKVNNARCVRTVKRRVGLWKTLRKRQLTEQAPPPRFSFHHLRFSEVNTPCSCSRRTASLSALRYGESERSRSGHS